MKIAFDFDDTISNRYELLQKWKLNKDYLEKTKEGLFKTKLFNYSLEVIRFLYSENDELYIISSTSSKRLNWIEDWLQEKEMNNYFKGIFRSNNKEGLEKEIICLDKGIDLLVDNEERHFTFKNPRLRRILFKPYKNINIKNIPLAKDWKEVYRIISKIKEPN